MLVLLLVLTATLPPASVAAADFAAAGTVATAAEFFDGVDVASQP